MNTHNITDSGCYYLCTHISDKILFDLKKTHPTSCGLLHHWLPFVCPKGEGNTGEAGTEEEEEQQEEAK